MYGRTTRSMSDRPAGAVRVRTPWSIGAIALVCVFTLTMVGMPLTASDDAVDANDGDPGAEIKCKANADCGKGQYCAKNPGDCDGSGVCDTMPTACPKILDPVCGCDNRTYDNACLAASAGVNVAYHGKCEKGACVTNGQCPKGFFCEKKVGDCDGKGSCTEKPFACLDVWIPVCGCDGKTYSNDCYAASAGVSVAYEGKCKPGACVANSQCKPDAYCAKEKGDCNGVGTCEDRPIYCLLYYLPTCGCDGVTYSNACFAAANGANVAFKGYCGFGPGPGVPMEKAMSPAAGDILRELDISGTGMIDIQDVQAVIAAWGGCESCEADFSRNGSVGAEDLLILLDWFGADVPAAPSR